MAHRDDRELCELIAAMSDDEARVLLAVARRLHTGRSCYGPLVLARDRRDWAREGCEEALDLAVYLAAGLIKAGKT